MPKITTRAQDQQAATKRASRFSEKSGVKTGGSSAGFLNKTAAAMDRAARAAGPKGPGPSPTGGFKRFARGGASLASTARTTSVTVGVNAPTGAGRQARSGITVN